ncbi:hypothetical protein MMC25_003655 [Agyrium rufum]|nr:hypothetical protein [Agyrium rufum]
MSITRPTDLKSLCLSCKDLRGVATPALYRKIHLFVGGDQDMHLLNFVNSSNPGLPFIREIFIRLQKRSLVSKRSQSPEDDLSSSEDEVEALPEIGRQAQFTLGVLLTHLPKDTLEMFSWQCWEPLNVQNMLLLCQKQRKLQCLEIGPVNKDLFPVMEKNPKVFSGFTELKSIDMYPDTVDRLKACNKLLQDHPQVQNLCISNSFAYSTESPDDLHDLSTGPGLITRSLFRHLLPFESCKPIELKHLDLDSQDLRYSPDTWLRAIKFSTLTRLEFRNCQGVDAVFAQLSKPNHCPTQLKILRWMDDHVYDVRVLEAFEGFVERCAEFGSKLTTIDVLLSKMLQLPKAASICRHKESLKSLSISCTNSTVNGTGIYSEQDFNKICTDCTKISQLSVMFPGTSGESPSLDLRFLGYYENTFKLEQLVTLVIRRWPQVREAPIGSRGKGASALTLYTHHLQRHATNLFEISDEDAKRSGYGLGYRSRLSVIAWGSNGETKYHPDAGNSIKLKQIAFTRGEVVDVLRRQSLLAVQTPWRLVQFVEPESEILNHALFDLDYIYSTSQQ